MSCLFHGAAATKTGAARAMIEAVKRIVFYWGMNAKKRLDGWERGCVAGNCALNERKACWIRECWEELERSKGATGQPRKERTTEQWSACAWQDGAFDSRGMEEGKGRRRNGGE